MNTLEIKNKIRDAIERLPTEKLKTALDFFEDLEKSEEDETQALLNEPGFIEDYRQAKKDIKEGKTVSWKNVKRNHQVI